MKKCCGDKFEQRTPSAAKMTPPSAAEINQLVALFNTGRLAEMENLAQLLLRQFPDEGFIWRMLGVAQLAQGKDALHAAQRACVLLPKDADAHYNFGIAQQRCGRVNEAVTSYRRALELRPDFIWAHLNLGNARQDLGQMEEALVCYRRALALQPDLAEAHFNMGNALKALARLDEAVASYRMALKLKADHPEALCNLGIALQNRGQLAEAVASYRAAIKIRPTYAEAYSNLGVALQEMRQFGEAESSLRRALELKPDVAESHSNLGNVLKDVWRLDEAQACYRRALQIKPDNAATLSNLLFVLSYSLAHSSQEYQAETRRYASTVSALARKPYTTWEHPARPERLRVGMVSGDLHNHPVGYFLEGLLHHIDPQRIQLFAYPTSSNEDALTARIRPRFAGWRPLYGKRDEEAAALIHADGLHVLLDLSGHTSGNRLPVFAWKPAPVQASWLGYFATTGMPEMDFLLADKVGVPPEDQGQFSETICYLPDTRLCFTPPENAPPVAALPALSNGAITIGCFQNLTKLGDDVLALWGEIFVALPTARLRMQCKQLGETELQEQMLQRLQRHGIAADRVQLLGSVSRQEYLAAHGEVDFILDTFPYPGGTTTCEALWMGVPTLTLAGENMLARQGASLLHAAGLDNWIAASKPDYVSRAIHFGNDLPALAKLRQNLRVQVQASPVFDAERFARNFENALWEMSGMVERDPTD